MALYIWPLSNNLWGVGHFTLHFVLGVTAMQCSIRQRLPHATDRHECERTHSLRFAASINLSFDLFLSISLIPSPLYFLFLAPLDRLG